MIKCGRPRKGEEASSRHRILDAALVLFLENGYGSVSLESIAKTARVSMRTLYNEFEGKAGLFGAVIKRYSDPFVSKLADENTLTGHPEAALIAFGKQFITGITQPEVLRMRSIMMGESLRFPDLAIQFYAQGPQRTLNQLEEFFIKFQQLGYFTAQDPHILADHFLSCLRNERLQKLQLGIQKPPTQDEIDIWVRQSTELFLKGSLELLDS